MYDTIIIGAGPAGLFSAANHAPKTKGLILEKKNKPGIKLRMSGSGQCNFTNAEDIKAFVHRYGSHGAKIRTALYRFNNLAVINYFESRGVKTLIREDGKVFPASLDSKDILDVLLRESRANGFDIRYEHPVDSIRLDDGVYTVSSVGREYRCRKLVVATGGCSYPSTGSDGDLFRVLQAMGISISPPRPALVPIFVHGYPYATLAGLSFQHAELSIAGQGTTYKMSGPLLFTHGSFSGPTVLNLSRYAELSGLEMSIQYFPGKSALTLMHDIKQAAVGNKKSVPNFLTETLKLPARFSEVITDRLSLSGTAASLSKDDTARIASLLTSDTFVISGTGGFKEAMATTGGVSLDEVDLRTFESKKYPRMHIIGEALDVDGDTGGYNIQFAFSSGYAVSQIKSVR